MKVVLARDFSDGWALYRKSVNGEAVELPDDLKGRLPKDAKVVDNEEANKLAIEARLIAARPIKTTLAAVSRPVLTDDRPPQPEVENPGREEDVGRQAEERVGEALEKADAAQVSRDTKQSAKPKK